MDLLLGTHVDTTGGFVQNQNVGVVCQPLGDDYLLLVTAGEVLHQLVIGRRLDFQGLDKLVCHFFFLLMIDKTSLIGNSLQGCQGGILTNTHTQHQALELPVFGNEADALQHGISGVLDVDFLTLNVNLTGLLGIDAEYGAHNLTAACANQTCKAQNLACAQFKVDIFQETLGVQILDFQHHIADGGCLLGIQIIHITADHSLDDVVLGAAFGHHAAGADAVTENSHFIGDGEDFSQLVGDKDDRYTLLSELTDDTEEDIGLGFRQRRGRLIHDDDLGVERQSFGNFDHLLLGSRQFACHGVGIHIQTYFIQQFSRLSVHLLLIYKDTAAAFFTAQEDILGNVHIIQNTQFLINDTDAHQLGCQGVLDLDRLTFHQNFALVHLVDTGKNLHQGRLACAVFADQRQNLTGINRQIHMVQGQNTGEPLGDTLHFQNGYPGITHSLHTPYPLPDTKAVPSVVRRMGNRNLCMPKHQYSGIALIIAYLHREKKL